MYPPTNIIALPCSANKTLHAEGCVCCDNEAVFHALEVWYIYWTCLSHAKYCLLLFRTLNQHGLLGAYLNGDGKLWLTVLFWMVEGILSRSTKRYYNRIRWYFRWCGGWNWYRCMWCSRQGGFWCLKHCYQNLHYMRAKTLFIGYFFNKPWKVNFFTGSAYL